MLCFHMYKPRTNLKQTLFKPQIYGAGPCHQARQDLKESSINFFFLRAATVDFLRCLELKFDWGLYI